MLAVVNITKGTNTGRTWKIRPQALTEQQVQVSKTTILFHSSSLAIIGRVGVEKRRENLSYTLYKERENCGEIFNSYSTGPSLRLLTPEIISNNTLTPS